jgi:GNAT superfamily N-acetyltransferase
VGDREQRRQVSDKPRPASTGVTVRAAGPDDVDALAVISVRSWQAGYAGVLPQAYLDGLRVEDRARNIRRMLDVSHHEGGAFLVGEHDRRVVGLANAQPSADADAKGEGELQTLYVHPEAWAHGVGSALLQASLDHLRQNGHAEAILWVLEGNRHARLFYEQRGWTCDGTTKPIDLGASFLEVRYRRRLTQ